MSHLPTTHARFYLALLASFSLACGSNPAAPTATSTEATTTTTTTLSTATTPTAPQSSPSAAPLTTNTTAAALPPDLHFSPADVRYLNTLDPEARALAIQRAQENLAAIREVHKLNNGYTDSLRNWSITTPQKSR